jgi:SAM-dependent methyltransferase
MRASRASRPISSRRLRLTSCPICGDPIETVVDEENCPGCNQRARTRSLGPVMEEIVWPAIDKSLAASVPMLAFATTAPEREQIDHGIAVKSVSLYGSYGSGNQEGVDVRDLREFESASFCGAYAILLFDYFLEHEQALSELARVIAPGGIFFTHIGPHRIEEGAAPPRSHAEIEARPGYFEYLPESHGLLDVRVGRQWLIEAIGRTGFDPTHVYVEDAPTGMVHEWFVGRKSVARTAGSGGLRRLGRAATSLPLRMRRSRHRPGADHEPPKIRAPIRRSADEVVHSVPVDPAFGFSRVVIRLSLPTGATTGRFGEHVWDEVNQETTPTVIATYSDGVAVSEDNGFAWRHVSLPAVKGLNVRSCFTTARGAHMLHALDDQGHNPVLLCFSDDWTLLDRQELARSSWHARGAIGERNGVIMFAEYPDNVNKYKLGLGEELGPDDEPPLSSRVYRSTDEGQTWSVAFEKDWSEIRHFHTLVPDPYGTGVWWLSSGDRENECRVWRSADDGISWQEATNTEPRLDLGPYQHLAQACHRHTDVYITRDELLWGADDWLGGASSELEDLLARRTGARFFVSPKGERLDPRPVGWAGNPVRTVTDVGDALLATTEAKHVSRIGNPQVFLISKRDFELSTELFRAAVFRDDGSGFTYSRASRAARDGVFYSHRGAKDVFDRPGGILRWQVEFL